MATRGEPNASQQIGQIASKTSRVNVLPEAGAERTSTDDAGQSDEDAMLPTFSNAKRGGLTLLLVFVTLLTVFPTSARAQVDFEIYAGPTISDITGSYVDSSIRTWGIVMGAVVNWRFHRRWAVESGISSAQMGAFEVKLADQDSLYDFRTSYLEIPVALQFLTPLFKENWLLGFSAGGAFGKRSACEVKEAGFPQFQLDCGEQAPGGEVNKTDFLIQFGVGMDRVFKGGSGFGFDVRYSMGTQDLFKTASDEGLSSRNSVLDIKFHFFLPLSGPR